MIGRILVIDDDKDMCLVLSKFLSKNDYEVDTAHTGEAGLKLLRDTEYVLILCDYRLPDITGVEALQKIKVLSPAVPVILITGYSDVRTAVEISATVRATMLQNRCTRMSCWLRFVKRSPKTIQKVLRVLKKFRMVKLKGLLKHHAHLQKVAVPASLLLVKVFNRKRFNGMLN